jgi:UDP-glucose 4-epimerase
MKILVVGGAGFLGSNVVRRCLREPEASVTVMDSLDPHLRPTTRTLSEVWGRIQFVRGDIRDEYLLAELVQGQDVIINCAAQTSHPLSIQYPLLDAEINCVGNLKLLESVRLVAPEAVVVYASSSTVIGKAIDSVVTEDHVERPLEIYSANKGVAEKYYRIYHTLHDLKTVVLRFANLYGPYGKGYPEFGFVNYFIDLAWRRQEIKVFGLGDQLRNLMYVEDASEILWRAARDPKLIGEVCFATGDEHLSVLQIAETIVGVLGRGTVSHVEWPEERRRTDVEAVRISSERLRALTGWRPGWTFKEGLERTRTILEGIERGSTR